jgi:hypothetical protein
MERTVACSFAGCRAFWSRASGPPSSLVLEWRLLHGFSAEQTLDWVEEAVRRLNRVTRDVVVTDLPLACIRRLSHAKFLVFRSVLVPSCRLSLTQVLDRAERVSEGLATLAASAGSRLVRLDPTWYGFDPVHFRRSSLRAAWRQILGIPAGAPANGVSGVEHIRLSLLPPERRWVFGVEQFTPQEGVRLRSGGRVWIY